ncbi:MAG: LPS export ABC transporter permease LptF [Ectothiorhodospiraceae bacterium]|jgi:lipopolysaccharide export system permease protein|nr:LPS export ABC transporter permease LptF [Ectothiorhodospiraceae bacterium]
MLKVIDRYLLREVGITTLAVIVVLLAIVLGANLARLLGVAAEGSIPADILLPIVAITSVNGLVLLLPAALFLSLLLALGRLGRDNEITVLRASGIGNARLFRSLLMLAIPLTIAEALLIWYATPWLNYQGELIRAEALTRSELAMVAPGRFMLAQKGQVVFFVERVSEDGALMRDVFLQVRNGGRTQVYTARSATQETDPASGRRYLVLQDGERYEGEPGSPAWQMVSFRRHGILLPDPDAASVRERPDSFPSRQLLDAPHPRLRGELQWRLALPLSIPVLVLLAIPLSHASPRDGRFGRLAAGVVLYAFYANGMIVARSWYESDVTPAVLGIWWVHLPVILLASAMLLLQRRRHRRRRAVRVAEAGA